MWSPPTMFPQLESRRAPRLPVSAPAVIAAGTDRWSVIAEDFAAGGCCIVSPVPLRRGAAAWVTLQLPAGAGEVAAAATVAWASPAPPYKIGFEFARTGAAERARQVRTLIETDPALVREPPPLRPSLVLRLGAPPDPRTFFSRDERAVLRAARDAVSLRELHARHASRCRENPPRGGDAAGAAAGGGGRAARLRPTLGGRARRATRWTRRRRPARPARRPSPSAPRAGRGRRAQAFVDLARAESVAGHDACAVEWLQAALAAAPGDPQNRGRARRAHRDPRAQLNPSSRPSTVTSRWVNRPRRRPGAAWRAGEALATGRGDRLSAREDRWSRRRADSGRTSAACSPAGSGTGCSRRRRPRCCGPATAWAIRSRTGRACCRSTCSAPCWWAPA